MADSNSEAQRCACGFWGTPQTMGLCSKCYKDQQKKVPVESSSGSSSETALPQATPLTAPLHQASTSSDSSEEVACDVRVEVTSEDQTDSTAQEDQAKPQTNKRDISDVQDPEKPVQKNRKRCFTCNCKLELAIREIGRCKCDYVFCQLHRLPEQHNCEFDHKGHGRREARDKMVSPKKHVGTTLRRLDSDT